MKFGEIVDSVYIDLRKFTEYALNPEHARGSHKARVFKSALGYDRENLQELKAQIEAKILLMEADEGMADKHGRRFVVDLPITGPSGKQAVVRTCWLVPPGSKEARLTTLLVRKKS